jgi:phage-related tail protein
MKGKMKDLDFIKIKIQDEYKSLIELIKEDKEKGIENKYLSGKADQLNQVEFWIDQMIDKNWNKEAIIFNYITKKIRL